MPFSPPTQAEIIQRCASDFRTEAGVNPMRRSVEYALLRALAGQSKGQYSFQEYIFRQCFVTSAEETYLWRWAAIWDILQKASTPWQGICRFTGTNTTIVPEGTIIVRSDGTTYETDADGTISGGYVDILCLASEDFVGTAGNNDDSAPLVLTTPISGVDSDVIVQSTDVDGTDVEEPEDGLVRLLQRLRTPPSGGVAGDYVRWALEVAGVTRAWERSPAPGDVYVSFVRDDDGTGSDILPSGGERTEVEDYVQTKAPITVEITAVELTAYPVEVTITDLDPDTLDVRDAIEESLEDFFYREGEPGGTINISRLREAISLAAGESAHTLVSPTANFTVAIDEMPIFDGLVVS